MSERRKKGRGRRIKELMKEENKGKGKTDRAERMAGTR